MWIVCSILANATEPETSSVLFLTGFELEWQKRPHRIQTLGFGARADSSEGPPAGELWADVRGGTWANGSAASDTPYGTVHYAGLMADRPVWVGSTVLQGRGDPGTPARGTLTVRLESPETDAAIWIRGFRLQSGSEHPVGYTVHGFGVELGEPRWVDGNIEFEVSAHMQAAGVPDRLQALKQYSAQFEIDWVVVPTPKGDLARHPASSRQRRRQIGLAEAEDRMPVTRVPLDWDVEAPNVIAGLSAFEVAVVRKGPVDGRYMRALQVHLSDGAYDPVRSHWSGEAHLRFANAGPVTRSLAVEVSAVMTSMALQAGERGWAGTWSPAEGAVEATTVYPD